MTAVILAGGKSRRMGRDKLSLPQGNTTVLNAAVERFSAVFDRVYISVRDRGRYPDAGAPEIEDIFKDCGPMGGLYSSLETAGESIFLVAADLPFSDPLLAKSIIASRGDSEICITVDGCGRYEPLFGYYDYSVKVAAKSLLLQGKYKMAELYSICRTKTLQPEELHGMWRETAFQNMNFPEDYEKLFK